jgi:DNA topoisomerase-2
MEGGKQRWPGLGFQILQGEFRVLPSSTQGLGTSTSADAKKYFSDLDKHRLAFEAMKPEDRALIDMAFSKKKADDRKEWLRQFKPGTFLDHDVATLPISDFVNKELILFSMADNIRSIPSVADGLKPGQRKVLFACFKRNLSKEIKVAQLAGYVSEKTAYHHGEQSLYATIVGLAQDFVGSNNISLLEPRGQFGTRLAVSELDLLALTTGWQRRCQPALHLHHPSANHAHHLPPRR